MNAHQLEYKYDALVGSDTIRVLHLLPTQDRLECTLQQNTYLDGGYQALSYVWGSQEKQHKMIVRDGEGKSLGHVSLTENLHHALCDLRDSAEVERNVFCIDQISINQKGDEKTH